MPNHRKTLFTMLKELASRRLSVYNKQLVIQDATATENLKTMPF